MDRVALQVYRASDRAPAEPLSTRPGFVLDAETEWIVEGAPDTISKIVEYLPGKIARRVGPVISIRFVNSVGRIDAGPLGTLVVRSGKWSEHDFDQMIEDIGARAVELPFEIGEPMALPYARDSENSRVLLHTLMWLRHAITEPSPLLAALRHILRDPERRLERETRTVPTELASSISARTIEDLCAGRWPLQRTHRGIGARGHLPLVIDDERVRPTIDLPENRFVKMFLDDAAHVVARIREGVRDLERPTARQIVAHCDAVDAAFTPIRRASIWRDVGQLSHLPVGSTVLQRRAPYREVLRHFLRMRAASRALPLTSDELAQILAVKHIALLYEMWCSFAVLGVTREVLGPPARVERIQLSTLGAKLAWGVHASWTGGMQLAINSTYTRTSGSYGRSMSVDLRPDVVLRVPHGPAEGLHVFDAKFRVVRTGEEEGAARVEDLHKMHTYRDAIAAVRSAWVLYPGDETSAFGDDGAAWAFPSTEPSPQCGIGAIGISPLSGLVALRSVLQAVLRCP